MITAKLNLKNLTCPFSREVNQLASCAVCVHVCASLSTLP